MNFTENTLAILKNFSEINPSVLFSKGNVLRTISPQKTAMASAVLDNDIEGDAAVYDLSRFLSTLTLFKDPDVKFEKDKFIITSGKSKVSYSYAARNMIMQPPEKDIELTDAEAVIDIQWQDIINVIRAAGVLDLGEITFRSDGNNVIMGAIDSKNPTSDNYTVTVAENVDNLAKFDMIIKVENLKLLQSDYTVSLSTKGIAHFKSANVSYWIALEAK